MFGIFNNIPKTLKLSDITSNSWKDSLKRKQYSEQTQQMLTIYFYTIFRMPIWNASLITSSKQKAKYTFRVSSIFLSYGLQNWN